MPWTKLNEIYIPDCSPQQYLGVFFNTVNNIGPPPDTWTTVDLSSVINDPDAKAVFLSGTLIITHGANDRIADLRMAFRRHGDTVDRYYNWQAIEALRTGGQRSTMSVIVPVQDQKFEWKWMCEPNGYGLYSKGYSGYAANLSLNGWGK